MIAVLTKRSVENLGSTIEENRLQAMKRSATEPCEKAKVGGYLNEGCSGRVRSRRTRELPIAQGMKTRGMVSLECRKKCEEERVSGLFWRLGPSGRMLASRRSRALS